MIVGCWVDDRRGLLWMIEEMASGSFSISASSSEKGWARVDVGKEAADVLLAYRELIREIEACT